MGNSLITPNARVGVVVGLSGLDCKFIGEIDIRDGQSSLVAAARNVDIRDILAHFGFTEELLPHELRGLDLIIDTLVLEQEFNKNGRQEIFCKIDLIKENKKDLTKQKIVKKKQVENKIFGKNKIINDIDAKRKADQIWDALIKGGCIIKTGKDEARINNLESKSDSELDQLLNDILSPYAEDIARDDIKKILFPQISLGKTILPLASLAFHVVNKANELEIKIHVGGNYESGQEKALESPFITCQGFALDFQYKQSNGIKWSIGGNLNLLLFNEPKPVEFKAAYVYDSKENEHVLIFEAENAKIYPLKLFKGILPELETLFAVGIKKIEIKKAGQEWEFSAVSYLELGDDFKNTNEEAFTILNKVLFPANGVLFSQCKSRSLRLNGELKVTSAEGVAFNLYNPCPLIIPSIYSQLEKLVIKDNEELKKLFEDGDLKRLLDIGDTCFWLDKVGIEIHKTNGCKLVARLSIGLPSKLNDVFFGNQEKNKEKNKYHGLIKTYDEEKLKKKLEYLFSDEGKIEQNDRLDDISKGPDDNLLQASLKMDVTSGTISGALEKGNFLDLEKIFGSGLKGIQERDEYIEIDFDKLLPGDDEFGQIKIKKPYLSLDMKSGAFKASGGYEISEPFFIPIRPIAKMLLNLIPLAKRDQDNAATIADLLPKGIPIRSIFLFKESSLLSWETKDTEAVELFERINGEEKSLGHFKPEDSKRVSPKSTATYTLIAKNEKRQAAKKCITLLVDSELAESDNSEDDRDENGPEIVSFKGQPESIKREEQLNLDEIERWLSDCYPDADTSFSLPAPFKNFAEQKVGEVVNRLPSAFKKYLNINLPRGFNFDIEITADGGVNFCVDVENSDLNKDLFYENCIQLLIPAPVGFGTLYGIQLKKLAFGTALFGTALRLDLSARVDVFDLVQLGASLLLPDKDAVSDNTLRLMIPDRKEFGSHLMLENLVMFIFYETVIPIPVPVFFKNIYSAYAGLEGFESKSRLGFTTGIEPSKIFKQLSHFPGYFGDPKQALWLKYPYSPAEYGINIGPIYTQLPGCIGYEISQNGQPQNIVIGTKDADCFDPLDLISLGANTLKFSIWNLIEAIRKEKPENFSQVPVTIEGQEVHKKPFNYLIEYLPIKKRMGFKKIKLFYIFDFDAAWAFTTPDEFEQIVYQRMLEEYPESNHPGIQDLSSPNDLLQLLVENNVAVSTHEDDQGVVLFLRGGMDLAKMISFEGAIGLMLSEQKGFRTGYSIKGKLFNWIETASFFFLKINPADRQEMIRVLGSTYLKVFERDVLKGRIELTTELNSRKLILQGMLDAFPAGFPIQLKGFVNGDFNDKIIRYDSHAGLQLGLFSAQAGLKIHIDKGKLLFSSDLIFANSFWHFSIEHKKENAQEWFRADLAANAFNLLALEGHLRFRRDTRRLQLLGMVSLDFPALKILSVQLDYAGEFNAATGFLSLSAQLGGNSYILSENCRPTGGAAFCIWFNKDPRGDAEAGEKAVSGPRAGDFVLTLGGYHPNFRLPAHYPRVPRLGINWEIDPYTHIRGEAYFAMTPLAVMAGAKLDLVYQRGNIRAWFLAYADFLCQWKPLYYDAKIAVSVGASYTLRVGIRVAGKFIGVTKTFSISIKALFHLYGPPTGGRVEIKLPIVTIGIHFGKPYEPPKPLENWQAFKKQFFDNDKNAAAGAILQIVPQSGVSTIKELADGSTAWIARADELSFMVTTKVPAGKVNGHPEPEKLINIKPLNKVNIGSALTVGLLRDREKIDAFEIQPIKSNVPAALWGSPDADLLDSEKALIPEAITGLHIFPKEAVREASALEIIDQNLGYSEIEAANGKNKLPDPGVVIAPRSPEPGSLEKLGEAIRAATSTRETVAKKLQDLNLFPKTDDLDFAWENLCREMKTDWRHWPDIIDH